MEPTSAPPERGIRRGRFLVVGAIGLGLVLVLAIVVAGFRDSVARSVLQSVGRGLGYDIATGSIDIGLTHLRADDVHVTTVAGEPVVDVRHVAADYSLRDLLPGGKRLFGLQSVEIDRPHITLIHHRDGTYNITLPATTNARPQANPPPLDLRLRVTGGTIDLVDRFVSAPRERHTHIVDIAVDGAISPSTPSTYRAGAVLVIGATRYPISGTGRFADARGLELQHFTAARLPIAELANFAISSHAVVVQAGELRDLDVMLGALATPAGTLQTHLGIRGRIVAARIASSALSKPVRDAHGDFVVDDDSATVRDLDATLNGLPLHLRGSLFHFAAPQVAFAVTARGDLSRVRGLSKDLAQLPIGGAVALQGLAEGSASNPVVFARFVAPHVDYGAYRLDGSHGFVAVSGQELDLISAGARYGAVTVNGRGAVQLQRHTRTTGFARIHVPADALPYVDNLVPGMPLDGDAVVHGVDAKLALRGYVGGAHGGDRLDVPFAIAEDRSATLGPVALERHDGASVYARAAYDARSNASVAILDARALSLLPAPAVRLPGLSVPVLPSNLDAKLDASVAGTAIGTTLSSANGLVHAYGSWGDLRADADGSGSHFGARGRVTSSFERLAAFTGNLGAHGGIDIPFAVTNGGRSTIVQIANARFPGATIRGIALSGADATLGIGPRAIDVYSADLRVAGREVTAQGSFGNGGRVHVTAGDVDLAALRSAGIPLTGGHATVIANLGGTIARPVGTVLAALAGARYAGSPVAGDVGVAYDGAALHVNRATLAYGGAYANAGGTISGLTPGHIAPRYDLRAQLEDADIATLARTVKNPVPYPEGTVNADLRVGGSGSTPSVAGEIRLPEGSVNGLSFRDGRIAINGTATAIRADGGHLTVGGTTLDFAGNVSRARQSVRLDSRHLDLADFNDYFDEAEVLAGTGSIALALDAAPNHLTTSADVALQGTRYRRFVLGTVGTTVRTVGTAIQLHGKVAGDNGRAQLDGSVNVPVTDPLRGLAGRSYVDLTGQIAGIDLGNVLPAAGLSVPVIGVLDGSAVVRGRYPALALRAKASVTRGVVGRLPIERFTLAATASNGRGRITDLSLIAPGLTANLTGSFGLRPTDPFDLRAEATSPNIATLASAATGASPGVTGALDTTSHVTGTIARPHLTTSVDLTQVTYKTIVIPGAHVDIDATRQAADVRHGNIRLPRGGSIGFDGHIPISTSASTPIAFDFVPHDVNIAPYSSLLPDGSVAEGLFDGNVGVRGTLGAPQLSGSLSFTGGSYRSNSIKGLTAIALQLDFSRTTVTIAKLHAHAAPGNFDGSGTVTLGDLRNPLPGLRADVTVTASNALVTAPKLYVGYIDGTVTAKKAIRAPLVVGGALRFSSARIPYTALLPSGATTSGAAPTLPDVDLNLGVTVGRDVRVQSGPVDIGTTGTAQLGGTLAKPTLDGQFNATDGTVAVYRTFIVQNGSSVSFTPSDGITPSVDATAVTHISDPATDVLLHITGLSTKLNLAFSSQPAYSKEQILGLLVNAQALGAVSGVAQSGSSSASSGPSITGIGEGLLNDQFTQKFLQPFSSKIGGALGLSDLNVNYNTNGAVSAVARRSLGKNISFTYGEQIGGPTPRTSIGINIGTAISGAQLTFYQAAGSSQAFGGQALTPYLQSGFLATSPPNYTLQAIEPPSGSGFVFSYQRHFW